MMEMGPHWTRRKRIRSKLGPGENTIPARRAIRGSGEFADSRRASFRLRCVVASAEIFRSQTSLSAHDDGRGETGRFGNFEGVQ